MKEERGKGEEGGKVRREEGWEGRREVERQGKVGRGINTPDKRWAAVWYTCILFVHLPVLAS